MRRDIIFDSEGARCAGWLYIPDDIGTNQGKPGIVLGQRNPGTVYFFRKTYCSERFASMGIKETVPGIPRLA